MPSFKNMLIFNTSSQAREACFLEVSLIIAGQWINPDF